MTDWRFIDSGACDAFLNMAVDEAIALSVRRGASPPTLRVYGWDCPSVSLGCFQKSGSIDLAACGELGIPVVRRITGGRAVLHGDELTYSFAAPTTAGPFSSGLLDSYRRISEAFCRAMAAAGFEPSTMSSRQRPGVSADRMAPNCFEAASFAEISLRGRKVVGSAQKRWTDGLLQQGSIPFSADSAALRRVFRQKSHEETLGLNREAPLLGRDEFAEQIRRSFEEVFGVRLILAALSEEEYRLALDLASRHYRSPAWTLRR